MNYFIGIALAGVGMVFAFPVLAACPTSASGVSFALFFYWTRDMGSDTHATRLSL